MSSKSLKTNEPRVTAVEIGNLRPKSVVNPFHPRDGWKGDGRFGKDAFARFDSQGASFYNALFQNSRSKTPRVRGVV
jgi:hypothetical protein